MKTTLTWRIFTPLKFVALFFGTFGARVGKIGIPISIVAVIVLFLIDNVHADLDDLIDGILTELK